MMHDLRFQHLKIQIDEHCHAYGVSTSMRASIHFLQGLGFSAGGALRGRGGEKVPACF